MMKKIDKSILHKIFGRTLMYGASWNYERMQNLGFLYSITPALKRLYEGASSEEKAKAMIRHLEFFNTHQSVAPFILGLTISIEEESGNEAEDTIRGIKVGLMGPLAGLGDSLIWLTLVPIFFSLGASYATNGNPIGLIIALGLINIINVPLKYYGLMYGYKYGAEFIQNTSKTVLDRLTNMAIALGLILVGALINQMVNINIGLTFTQGDLNISLQEVIDGIIPGLVPMVITLLFFYFIRKGNNPVILIFITMIVTVILSAFGILV